MSLAGETELRSRASKWQEALVSYSANKSITDVLGAMNASGADCSFQQIRYWLSGETICPRDKNIIDCIAIVSGDVTLQRISDIVFAAGGKVQGYHQQAGRWLTNALRSKAKEIKAIASQSGQKGIIEEIGEIRIFTVEEVLEKTFIQRGKINRTEAMY
jgi:hypothetical protein